MNPADQEPPTTIQPGPQPTANPQQPLSPLPVLPEPPVSTASVVSHPRRNRLLVPLIVVVLIAAGAVPGIYLAQQKKIDSLNKEVTGLKSRVSSLQVEAAAQRTTDTSSTSGVPIYGSIQQKARDTERQTDINALQVQLEAYFSQSDHYPSLAELNSATWRATNMKGLDDNALIDALGDKPLLAAKPAARVYAYDVSRLDGSSCEADNTTCAKFVLTATFEVQHDGKTTFTKENLND